MSTSVEALLRQREVGVLQAKNPKTLFTKQRKRYTFYPQRPFNIATSRVFSHLIYSQDTFVRRLRKPEVLEGHSGCVNTIQFDYNGDYLISGSDDRKIIVWDVFQKKPVISYRTPHRSNIFCARFMPHTGNKKVISCGGDSRICVTDLEAQVSDTYTCHGGHCVYKLAEDPTSSNIFYSSGDDATVRLHDLREKHSCNRRQCSNYVLVMSTYARPARESMASIESLCINTADPTYLAVGGQSASALIFDRRMLSNDEPKTVSPVGVYNPHPPGQRNVNITSIAFHPNGKEFIASYSGSDIYAFHVDKHHVDNVQNRLDQEARSSFRKRGFIDSESEQSSRSHNDNHEEKSSSASKSSSDYLVDESDEHRASENQEIEGGSSDSSSSASFRAMEAEINLAPESVQSIDDGNLHNLQAPHRQDLPVAHGAFHQEAAPARETMEAENRIIAIHQVQVSNIDRQSDHESSSDGDENFNFGSHDSEDEDEDEESLFDYEDSEGDSGGNGNDHGDDDEDDDDEDDDDDDNDSDEDEDEDEDDDVLLQEAISRRNSTIFSIVHRLSRDRRNLTEPWSKNYSSARYSGHQNNMTIKEVSYFGPNGEYIVSGDDYGRIFFWDRKTEEIVHIQNGDRDIVNCVQGHPKYPILATSGIENHVKLWFPDGDDRGSMPLEEFGLKDASLNNRMIPAQPLSLIRSITL